MLKIKDDVDLKELEKFGFKINNTVIDTNKINCLTFEFLTISQTTRYIDICSGYDEINGYEEIEKLFDLIQAGLIEKVERKQQ